jgi:hypothetical protein
LGEDEDVLKREGPLPVLSSPLPEAVTNAPVAIVWGCGLGVDAWAALGREVEVPRFGCPACGRLMVFWGFYCRHLRIPMSCWQLWVRRQRCSVCRTSHGILPSFVTFQRFDHVDVIGQGIEAMVAGRGSRPDWYPVGRRITIQAGHNALWITPHHACGSPSMAFKISAPARVGRRVDSHPPPLLSTISGPSCGNALRP